VKRTDCSSPMNGFCRLLRLMDKRYRGIARGVGQSEIVGRIHVAPLKVNSSPYVLSTVAVFSIN